jgi:hypothetical protein
MISWLEGIFIAAAAVPLLAWLARLVYLLPPYAKRWWGKVQSPLTERERERLHIWELRTVTWLILFILLWVLLAYLVWTERLDNTTAVGYANLVLIFGLSGLIHHFWAFCPRCKMNIGVQTALLLPKRCRRCKVALKG